MNKNKETQIQKAMGGIDYINCDKMHARIPRATCIARQKANLRSIENPKYFECVICEQGKKNIMKNIKLCKDCGLKPPISEKSLYCASCMAKRANEAKRAKKEAENTISKGGITQTLKKVNELSEIKSTRFTIEFGEHAEVLKEIEKLADAELRSVENQIIYILKNHLKNPIDTRPAL